MKRYWVIIPLVLGLYLYFSYTHIYSFIGQKHLGSPYTQTEYSFRKVGNAASKLPLKSLKYVALGDSLTAGVGASDINQTYPYLFAQHLLADSDEVVLVNLARPGARSADVLNNQLPEALAQNPDYVSILIGVNDVQGLISIEEFKKNYQLLLDRLAGQTHAKIIILNIPNLGAGSLVTFPYNLLYAYQTQQYNKILSEMSGQRDLNLVDVYSPTEKLFQENPTLYSSDLFHPSSDGYILWGRFMTDAN